MNKPDALALADQLEANRPVCGPDAAQAAAELRRLHAENEALRKDAERYRWLRERYPTLTRMESALGLGLDLSKVYVNTREKFDAAIDAAMK